MSSWQAMRLAGLLRRRPHASQDVLAVRHRLKMSGVHAAWCAAEMVDGKAGRDRADRQLIGVSMGQNHLAGDPEASIALILRGQPEPARAKVWRVVRNRPSLVDLGPEARGRHSTTEDYRFARQRVAMPPPARVVGAAQRTAVLRVAAVRNGTLRSHSEFLSGCHGLGRSCVARPLASLHSTTPGPPLSERRALLCPALMPRGACDR